jgi:outer membrane protein
MQKIGIFLCVFVWLQNLSAQEIWSLEKCVKYAQDNSLSIKQAAFSVKNAQLTQKGNELSRYPSVNASVGGGMQFGRSIDPTSNTFNSRNFGYNNGTVSFNVPIFNGFRIQNSIKQSQIDVKAAEADAEQAVQNLALNVASAYLQVLLAGEQLANAQRTIAISQDQLARLEKLIKVGSQPENSRFDVQAKIASDEQRMVTAKNQEDLAYLNLKQLLLLDMDYDLRIEKPNITLPADVTPENIVAKEVYVSAITRQPQVRAGDLRLQSAKYGIDIAKAQLLPTLGLGGSTSTNFSSLAQRIKGFQDYTVKQSVEFNGQKAEIGILQKQPILEDTPYGDQVSNNFGQGIGLSLNIPIYNNGRSKIAVERANLNILNQEIANRRIQEQLKSDVNRAVADARAAKKQYEAAEKTVAAQRNAFNNTEKRYQIGAMDTFLYTQAKNNLDVSESNLISAKYEYLFRLKVIDFYMGKNLTIN